MSKRKIFDRGPKTFSSSSTMACSWTWLAGNLISQDSWTEHSWKQQAPPSLKCGHYNLLPDIFDLWLLSIRNYSDIRFLNKSDYPWSGLANKILRLARIKWWWILYYVTNQINNPQILYFYCKDSYLQRSLVFLLNCGKMSLGDRNDFYISKSWADLDNTCTNIS